ncbi:MAG: helix-turn-helix domain-containing protein, partial [Methanolobus sp.]|nr:helix-turn-helix domain-containing protein [Methanolobus sp.]
MDISSLVSETSANKLLENISKNRVRICQNKTKQNKAYKFRLYPNSEQIEFFVKSFGCCRFIFNRMLGDKIEVDSLALANEQLTLQQAFKNFFRDKKIGFSKFKSRKHSRRTC